MNPGWNVTLIINPNMTAVAQGFAWMTIGGTAENANPILALRYK